MELEAATQRVMESCPSTLPIPRHLLKSARWHDQLMNRRVSMSKGSSTTARITRTAFEGIQRESERGELKLVTTWVLEGFTRRKGMAAGGAEA